MGRGKRDIVTVVKVLKRFEKKRSKGKSTDRLQKEGEKGQFGGDEYGNNCGSKCLQIESYK